MKKLISIMIISVFVLSLFGMAIAQEPTTISVKDTVSNVDGEAKDTTEKPKTPLIAAKKPVLISENVAADRIRAKEKVVAAPGLVVRDCVAECREKEDVKCISECRASNAKEKRMELVQTQKFANLKEEQRVKLQKLSMLRIQKIEKLDARQIQKINALEANNIRRITVLDEAKLKKVSNLDDARLKKLALLNRKKIKVYSDLKEDQLKVKIDKLKIVNIKKDERFVKRVITVTKVKNLNTKYDDVKEKYLSVKKAHNENKENFAKVKERFKECEGSETADCEQVREETLTKAKDYALGISDTLTEHLNKVRNRIESAESLSEENSAKAIEEIDSLINSLEEMKRKIDAAATKAELKEATKELKKLALKVRKRARIRAAGLLHDGVARLIKLAELSGEKADCSIAQLEEEGVDVTELDALLDEHTAKIEAAKEDFKEARELLLTGTETKAKDAQVKIKDARVNVKESLKLMLELRQQIRENDGKVCQKEEITTVEEEEEKSMTELITEEVPLETEAEETADIYKDLRPRNLAHKIQDDGILVTWDSPVLDEDVEKYVIATKGWGFRWSDVGEATSTSYLIKTDTSQSICDLDVRVTPIDKNGDLLKPEHLNNIRHVVNEADFGIDGICGPQT